VAKLFGVEQIVFGSDFPFGFGQEGMQYIEKAVWVVEQSGLSDAEREQIFCADVKALLKITV
jgi:predicted TIM-barrel fold metal-dependent hydrolase